MLVIWALWPKRYCTITLNMVSAFTDDHTIQLTVHFRSRPQGTWAKLHVTTRHVIDGYHDEDTELWDEGGRLIAQSRQLAILA